MHATTIETATAVYTLGDDGIIRGVLRPHTKETLATAHENTAAVAALAGGIKRAVLVDIRASEGLTREARLYYSGDEMAKCARATAMLIDSGLSRMFGNFFIGLNRELIPTRLFTDEEEALAWLGGQRP